MIQPTCAHQPPSRGRVRVNVLVGVLMMDAMSGYPGDRPSFKCQGAADCQEVLEGLGRLVGTVCEQPVIAHADAPTDCDKVQQRRHDQGLPFKHEKGGGRANVE